MSLDSSRQEVLSQCKFYSLPPFFSVQRVEETRQRQLAMWLELLMNWQQVNCFSLVSVSTQRMEIPFRNDAIDRGLSAQDMCTVLDYCIAEGYGFWLGADHEHCVLSWHTIQDWAQLLHTWAVEAGLAGQLSTIYELRAGDATRGEEFHGLDGRLIKAALDLMVKQQLCTLIIVDSVDETGVKWVG